MGLQNMAQENMQQDNVQRGNDVQQDQQASPALQQSQSSQNLQQTAGKHCPICGGPMKGDEKTGYVCLDCFLIFDKENVS